MSITTRVSISSDGNGGAVLLSGRLEGAQGRTVTIQASPSPGYVFDRWEIVTSPVELSTFAVVASVPVNSVEEVCFEPRSYDGYTTQYSSTYQNVARELFTDGTMLYLDTEGRTPAPTGYWGAGGGTYYYWTGGRLPVLQACAGTGTGGGSGGGGGSDENTNLLTSTSGEFDQTARTGIDDIRFT